VQLEVWMLLVCLVWAVFASGLSGNTIVLGASLAQGDSTKALLGIFIFIGYMLGTALATFLLRKEVHNTVGLSTEITYMLGIELVLLSALFFQYLCQSGFFFI
jgi:uncharacterized membrane protein YoaK (UPF0700 family)